MELKVEGQTRFEALRVAESSAMKKLMLCRSTFDFFLGKFVANQATMASSPDYLAAPCSSGPRDGACELPTASMSNLHSYMNRALRQLVIAFIVGLLVLFSHHFPRLQTCTSGLWRATCPRGWPATLQIATMATSVAHMDPPPSMADVPVETPARFANPPAVVPILLSIFIMCVFHPVSIFCAFPICFPFTCSAQYNL